MSDGVGQAAQAFAEDLGGGSELASDRRPSHEGLHNSTAVERIIHPSQEHFFEHPEGEEELGDGVDHGRGNDGENARDARRRGPDGKFRKDGNSEGEEEVKKPSKGKGSIEDLLDDHLDEEDGDSDTEEGEEGGDPTKSVNGKVINFKDLDHSQEIEVTVDGKPHKVSVREAVDGYIRQETFHRRLTDVDKVVKDVRRQTDELAQGREHYIGRLQHLESELDSLTPKEPDWQKLYADDPQGAPAIERQWNDYKRNRDAIKKEIATETEKQNRHRQESYRNFVEDGKRTFAQAHPEYTEPREGAKRFTRDRDGMIETAKNHGFSDDEINNIVDPRHMEILLKASKYDRLQSRAANIKANRTDGGKENAGRTSRIPAKLANAQGRLSKSGSISDATSVFEAELRSEGA